MGLFDSRTKEIVASSLLSTRPGSDPNKGGQSALQSTKEKVVNNRGGQQWSMEKKAE